VPSSPFPALQALISTVATLQSDAASPEASINARLEPAAQKKRGSGEPSCIVLVAQTALERAAAYSLDFVESLDKDFIRVVAGKGSVEACRRALPASGTPFELLKFLRLVSTAPYPLTCWE